MMLTSEELLAGSQLVFAVDVPDEVLHPDGDGKSKDVPRNVRLRPLTVSDLQVISRAAKENDQLIATLMVQRSLIEPELSIAEAGGIHVGLMQFLLQEVNRISGISIQSEQQSVMIEAPLAKAAFILSREFGWTPGQINDLTLGQIMLHLQMLKERSVAR